MAEPIDTGRIRGWILVRNFIWEEVLDNWDALSKLGKDKYVIIRASFVDAWPGDESTILFSIDALEGDDPFKQAIIDIKGVIDIKNYEEVIVDKMIPEPPHIASGYITRKEAHDAIDKGERGGRPGRQDHSPGFNPWG